ncbi:flagellar motor switch protein FliN/FliY [Anaerobranca californiensis DSM 14826]|jgi:flagellar motor switch protein FliN/FliY|uniref:Flagellar motor switch protein FliN/FliY n=1 Tax=Anaerobranca californiensis DSM 14826 TaxID=1120989 RepID=A0A1M6KI83_9FIRM|nr:flagellar motor switch phosphatase FliY [Anaerobranca californiensis]SHJ58657.1 flagellar motor switch protein FliN/FliY [Anaerobranca californiensis DSM 14826]
MSDILSQEEIDALLSADNIQREEVTLTEWEKDAIGEIGNISFGSAATSLSNLLNQRVEITTPYVELTTKEKISEDHPVPCLVVEVSYTEGIHGANILIIQQRDAKIIANLMMGGDGKVDSEELTEIDISAVSEAMNQMMGGAATALSTIFGTMVNISPPTTKILNLSQNSINGILSNEELVVKVAFRMVVGNLIDSIIMQLLPIDFFKELVGRLSEPQPEEVSKGVKKSAQQSVEKDIGQEKEQKDNLEQREIQYQKAQFSQLQPVDVGQHSHNIGLIMDVPLEITVELGRTRKKIKDILSLGTGSIIELEKMAGEPVEILANGKVIARGEVVVINENFGVRITSILTPIERVQNLQ